jgi:hypothetical protein
LAAVPAFRQSAGIFSLAALEARVSFRTEAADFKGEGYAGRIEHHADQARTEGLSEYDEWYGR